MNLLQIFRFEFLYQLRRPTTWLFLLVVAGLAFAQVRGNYLSDALYDDFYLNSPFVITVVTVFACLVWLMVAAAVSGEAIGRDAQTGMYPLTFTTPVKKFDYLAGKFIAAFVLNTLILLCVPFAIMLSVYMPGVDAEVIGPFRAEAYMRAFFFVALPNTFATTAIQFSFVAVTRRPMTSYFCSLILFFQAYVMGFFIGVVLDRFDLARLFDPVGAMTVVSDIANNWTPAEKSTRMLELDGVFLWNRVLWIDIGLLALTITYFRFQFAHHTQQPLFNFLHRVRKQQPARQILVDITPITTTPKVEPGHRRYGNILQIAVISWSSFWILFRRRGGFIILGFSTFVLAIFMTANMDSLGVQQLPRTEYVLHFITTPLNNTITSLVLIPLIIVVFAGELIWREREAGISEMIDTSPVAGWTMIIGKYLGLVLFLCLWMTLLIINGLFSQIVWGYDNFEIGLFIRVMFGLQLPEYLMFAALALLVHTVANQKYTGHLVAFAIYVAISFATLLGIEHQLIVFASSPSWYYTDMRGFGSSLGPWLWFKLYWMAWALLFFIGINLLWVRGKENSWPVRLSLARQRFQGSTKALAFVFGVMILSFGGYIFYNTNFLNQYKSKSQAKELRADYERLYRRYDGLIQPRMTGINLRVEIYPKERSFKIDGRYTFANHSKETISSLHLTTAPGVQTIVTYLDRAYRSNISDHEHHYHAYDFEEPLKPGDSLVLNFEVVLQQNGFTNTGYNHAVVANGSYFTQGDQDWLPEIGYQTDRELANVNDRRKFNLPNRTLIPSLYDVKARNDTSTFARVNFEAIVGTDEGQVGVTTGTLIKSWTESSKGETRRAYFHYKTSRSIPGSFSFFSARYALKEEVWNDVVIRIYYHPEHTINLDHIVKSARVSLEYHVRKFGPYPYRHFTIIERGGASQELSAEPSFVDYSEGFSRFNPKEIDDLDMPFAVMAHETGHQWWGGLVSPAYVEGGGVMSESLAWYSAMGVVEEFYGEQHVQKLRQFFRQPMPIAPIRQTVPLIRAADAYANYRKGPAALYAMSKYVGKDKIDGALKALVEKHNNFKPHLATTLDLYEELRANTPDTLQYLVHDLFEANTSWDLETDRATSTFVDGGRWEVRLDIDTRKFTVDSTGVEVDVPMNDWIDVGVYGEPPAENKPGKLIYYQRHRLGSGKQTISVKVNEKPARAGIDPLHLMVDLETHDNFAKVN